MNVDGTDLFSTPIAAGLPTCMPSRPDHPLAPLGTGSGHGSRATGPLQSNKFYANMLMGEQNLPVYVLPYSVSWTRGQQPTYGWGLTVSHATAEQRVFGPSREDCGHSSRPNSYYFSPPMLPNLVLDAAELGPGAVLTVDERTDMSALVSLRMGGVWAAPAVQFPLVQGQGFVTGIYGGARPLLRSGQAILSVESGGGGSGGGVAGPDNVRPGVTRYVLRMNDGATWLVYARRLPGTAPLVLQQTGTGLLAATTGFYGSVQVTRVPAAATAQGWTSFDHAAGVFATGVRLEGQTAAGGSQGTYRFVFAKADAAGDAAFQARARLLVYALPHHCASFDGATRAATLRLTLATPTKGDARAVLADAWTLVEPELPTDLAFLPWDPRTRRTAGTTLPPSARAAIAEAARRELAEDMDAQTDLESTYFAGKGLAKFASIVLATAALAQEAALAAQGLARLKTAFARFSLNRQKRPLTYEGTWGGVVSTAAYTTGDAMADFGSSYYNDHHFHYGYFVYAGAVIAHLDPTWLTADGGAHAAFVDMLARDYANPSARDALFPVFRSFDWYHGHSWAHGLFLSVDGKNQESSSEDALSLYALKLWGRAKGDAVLEARGSLMMAVLARSLQTYYYYYCAAAAAVEPAAFVGNQVGGIMFENKIDHTTFFGGEPALIHGIHMLPLLPCSPFFRPPAFVRQEWQDTFSRGRADAAPGGWIGVLYGNLATADPRAAYAFFRRPDYPPDRLDGGASRTWYLAYAAALGGADN